MSHQKIRHRSRHPQKLTEEHLQRMNIGRRYWAATLDAVEDSRHKSMVEEYLDQFDANFEKGWGLWLWGQNSTGKTWTACACLKQIVSKGYSAYCVLSDVLKSAYIDGERFDPHQTIVQRVESVDVLLLEDLGKEYSGKGSGWAELNFENMIRKRSRNLQPTIVTTNLTPSEFKERYKQSAAAIALESMTPCEVKGDDLRRKAANAKARSYRERR